MGMVPAAIRRIAGPTRPVDAALRLSLNGRLFQESEGRVSESNRERVPDEPTGSAAAVLRKRIGWIVFGAVSFFWLPAVYALLRADLVLYPRPVGLDLLVAGALFALCGLLLGLPCGLIRWVGFPRTAWAILALLGLLGFLFSAMMLAVAGSGSGPYPSVGMATWIIGYSMTIFSMPAWLAYAVLHSRRIEERRSGGTKSRGDGRGDSEMRNRPDDPP